MAGKRILIVIAVLINCQAFSQKWEKLNTLDDTRRISPIVAVLKDKAYVGFGHDHNTVWPFNDLWEYDSKIDQWKEISYLDSQNRTNAFSFAVGTDIYVGGGTRDSGKTALTTFFKFNILEKRWTRLKDLPFKDAIGAMCVLYHNKPILVGGCTTYECDSNIYEYDVDQDIWNIIALNKIPGRFGCAFVLGDDLFIGLNSQTEINLTKDMWKMSLKDNTWHRMKSFKGKPRSRVVYGVIDSTRAFVGLGCRITGDVTYDYSPRAQRGKELLNIDFDFKKDIWIYDSGKNTWTEIQNMEKGRRSGIGFYLDGYLYVGFGNEENTVLRDFMRMKLGK